MRNRLQSISRFTGWSILRGVSLERIYVFSAIKGDGQLDWQRFPTTRKITFYCCACRKRGKTVDFFD